MPDQTDTQPVLDPPNGHAVSGSEIYQALYKMDLANSDRHNILATQIEGIRTDHRQLRSEFFEHTQKHTEAVTEEIKLDAKKAGIIAGLLAVVGTMLAFVRDLRPF